MPYTILVADDEPAIRTMLEVILSADGHEIITAPDGAAALEYLRAHTPDIMLLDVQMPHVGGYEICSRVKRMKRLRSALVLLMTHVEDEQTRDQSKLVGADGLVSKPISGKQLRTRLALAMEERNG